MAPSDSSRRRDGLGCRLVLPVAVAVRSPWGLPCSARSVVRVPSLIPRRSPSLRVSSGFTAGAAFARSGGARPPQLCYGATCRFTGVTARVLAPPGLRRGPRGSCAAGRATCVDDRSHGEPPSAHAERAALHGAPRPPDMVREIVEKSRPERTWVRTENCPLFCARQACDSHPGRVIRGRNAGSGTTPIGEGPTRIAAAPAHRKLSAFLIAARSGMLLDHVSSGWPV
jgi:hypothetical protein